MKYLVVPCFAGAFFLAACGNLKQPVDPSKQDSLQQADSSKNSFFPVAEYLETEILHVDSVPLALRKYTTLNGKTDSAFILVPEFNQLAMRFLPPELHDSSFEKQFTESYFMDKYSQSIMLTYSTTVKDQPLRRVDVQKATRQPARPVKKIYL